MSCVLCYLTFFGGIAAYSACSRNWDGFGWGAYYGAAVLALHAFLWAGK